MRQDIDLSVEGSKNSLHSKEVIGSGQSVGTMDEVQSSQTKWVETMGVRTALERRRDEQLIQ